MRTRVGVCLSERGGGGFGVFGLLEIAGVYTGTGTPSSRVCSRIPSDPPPPPNLPLPSSVPSPGLSSVSAFVLSAGSRTQVYRGVLHGTPVAVKRLFEQISTAGNPDFADDFAREVKVLRSGVGAGALNVRGGGGGAGAKSPYAAHEGKTPNGRPGQGKSWGWPVVQSKLSQVIAAYPTHRHFQNAAASEHRALHRRVDAPALRDRHRVHGARHPCRPPPERRRPQVSPYIPSLTSPLARPLPLDSTSPQAPLQPRHTLLACALARRPLLPSTRPPSAQPSLSSVARDLDDIAGNESM